MSAAAAATGTARPAPRQQPAPSSPIRRSSTRPTASKRRATASGCSRATSLIKQGDRTLKTRNANYDAQDAELQRRRGRRVRRSGPQGERQLGATSTRPAAPTFEGAKFELTDRNARGSADRIQVTRDHQLKLDDVRYTTCPLGEEDWVLRASDIDIRQRAGLGFGRSVRLDFKGVPILYTPFISFPVGNQRKSGFLFPSLGTSSRSGYSLSVP